MISNLKSVENIPGSGCSEIIEVVEIALELVYPMSSIQYLLQSWA